MRVMEGGGGREGKNTSGDYSTVFVSNGNVISAFGHAIISHDFFEPTFEQCLVVYLSLHRWPSLRYYPAPSTIRYCVGLAKEAYYIFQQQPQCEIC